MNDEETVFSIVDSHAPETRYASSLSQNDTRVRESEV
jgi:hypothetical protein